MINIATSNKTSPCTVFDFYSTIILHRKEKT